MKIIIDNFVPYAAQALAPFAEVVELHADQITPTAVADADALIVRTRTQCNGALLEGSAVQFVGTATIGYDHIDRTWCNTHNITTVSAAGCNARGVLQWVSAALAHTLGRLGLTSPEGLCIGVVGVGNVGSLVADYCRSWGFRVLCSDPPREVAENLGPEQDFVPLAELVAQADIVTLHTPLIRTGQWPTYHLVDSNFVATMKPGATLLNASRGEVADTAALISPEAEKLALYIDVWEGEPHHLNPTLLSRAKVATTHIAGYSLQGKANASAIVVRTLAQHFGIEQLADWYPSGVTPSAPHPISWAEMSAQIGHYCPLDTETEWLRSHPTEFDQHRNTYPLREEFF